MPLYGSVGACVATLGASRHHAHLTLARRRLDEAAPRSRSTSHMEALINLLITTPAVSATAASQSLGITAHAARGLPQQAFA